MGTWTRAEAWSRDASELIVRDEDAARLAALIESNPVTAVVGPLGIGKTELVRSVVERETAAGRLPPGTYASLAGVGGAREVLERTSRALGRGHPPMESSRLLRALGELVASTRCTLVWDDVQDATLDTLAAALNAILPSDAALTGYRIVLVSRDRIFSGHAALQAWAKRVKAPTFEVPPLDAAACRRLIDKLEAQRGRSLQDELVVSSGGNPLSLHLGLAARRTSGGDPIASLRGAIDALPAEAHALLVLLAAADTPLRDDGLRAVFGPASDDSLLVLARHSLLARKGERVWVPPAMSAPVRSVVGAPQPGTWGVLEAIARRTLVAEVADPEALLLACRALVQQDRPREALALLRRQRGARAAASAAALEHALTEVARMDPAVAADAHLVLAREQLRWGDFEAARRTLDSLSAVELPEALVHRRHILRAEALVRAGEPAGAAQELERARPFAAAGTGTAVEIALAELALLRGDLVGARRALLRLAPLTRTVPAFEGRREAALALSYLFEERHDRALARARRARRSYARRDDAAIDMLVPVVEIAALMGLDQIDLAAAVAAREAGATPSADGRGFAEGLAILLQGGILFRRGEFEEAMRIGEPAFRALDRRADRIVRARVAHYLARSAIGLGLFELAESFVRIALGIAAEPGLGVLRPMCEVDLALLCEARGDRVEAARRIRLALAGSWRSPLAEIDAWAFGEDRGLPPRATYGSARAYSELRSAERSLERGDLRQAEAAAAAAEHWYRAAGALYELARAHLARAEAQARIGASSQARTALGSCMAIAQRNAYLPLLVSAHLVGAFLAERSGDLGGCGDELRTALEHANPELRDATLLRACARAGLATEAISPGPGQPLASRIARLGLDRPARFLVQEGQRAWLVDADEEPPGAFDVTVALDQGCVRSSNAELPLPPQRIQLLEQLASAGADGVTLEMLYRNVWGGREYHPLRHRNAVYVALTRLRESVASVLARDAFVEISDGRYRISPSVRVAVRRHWTGRIACRLEQPPSPLAPGTSAQGS